MADTFELIRLESDEAGTFGVLCHNGQVFCLTLEPPDRNNAPDISCIPTGRYGCRRARSPRFGPTFEVTGVPGRTHILFHQGNVAADTHGCVLLGSRYGALGRARGVLDSGAAFGAFLARCDGLDGFELTISKARGEG